MFASESVFLVKYVFPEPYYTTGCLNIWKVAWVLYMSDCVLRISSSIGVLFRFALFWKIIWASEVYLIPVPGAISVCLSISCSLSLSKGKKPAIQCFCVTYSVIPVPGVITVVRLFSILWVQKVFKTFLCYISSHGILHIRNSECLVYTVLFPYIPVPGIITVSLRVPLLFNFIKRVAMISANVFVLYIYSVIPVPGTKISYEYTSTQSIQMFKMGWRD